MSVDDPRGPLVLCYDGSDAAEHAIRIAPILVGRGRAARMLYAYTPTERSLGMAQGIIGGRGGPAPPRAAAAAPALGESDAHAIVDRAVGIARDAGSEAEPLLKVADRRTAALVAETAE